MATYAIGDIQGCFDELQNLLQIIDYSPRHDQLWFVGDLVNRGPKSLKTLRFIKQLKNTIVVLGNHDLHLLAAWQNVKTFKPSKQLIEILDAPDCDELLNWLRQQKLLHYDAKLNYLMVHAGLPSQWNLKTAKQCATELETALRSDAFVAYLHQMHGNHPDLWHPDLSGMDRLRFITNCLTRIRFCSPEGQLNLSCASKIGTQPPDYLPWFKLPDRHSKALRIIFGHWAALSGVTDEPNIFALDTGCVWGGKLTAMRLEDQHKSSVASEVAKRS